MEDPVGAWFPKVDSLPDGFTEGAAELTGPHTPSTVQGKPWSDLRGDSRSGLTFWRDSMFSSAVCESETGNIMSDMSSKLRDFTIAVLEYQNQHDRLNFPDRNGCSGGSSNESFPEVPRCYEVEEQADGEFCNSERSSEVELTVHFANVKEVPLVNGEDLLKIIKKQESAEIKRKSSKPCDSMSAEEFQDFILRYQQVLSERDAAISVREKLESLCRELQYQNKTLMDECKRVSKEGQNSKLQLSAKFQDAIKEVTNKLEQQKNECLSHLEENEMLKINLKQLADQFALSEMHHEQQLKQKNLELQIADLKIKQHEEKASQERTRTNAYADQISELLETEENLRSQLTSDREKLLQFQEALWKFSEHFDSFKPKICQMEKSNKNLRQENMILKSKCERTDLAIIELVEDRERTKKQMEKMKNQKDKLESLCRSLHAERKQNAMNASNGPVSV